MDIGIGPWETFVARFLAKLVIINYSKVFHRRCFTGSEIRLYNDGFDYVSE